MKKALARLTMAVALALGGGVAIVQPAQAASISVPIAAPIQVAPPQQLGGVKPAWLYVSCYLAMDGATYCWRYACTFYERVVLGCYNGWYRTSIWYA